MVITLNSLDIQPTAINKYQNTETPSKLSQEKSAQNKALQENVSISTTAQNRLNAEQDIANRYDLTNISHKEKENMSKELYDNGLITLFEMGLMNLDQSLKKHLGIEYNENDKVNYLQNQKDYLQFLTHNNDSRDSDIKIHQDFVSKLINLNSLKNS